MLAAVALSAGCMGSIGDDPADSGPGGDNPTGAGTGSGAGVPGTGAGPGTPGSPGECTPGIAATSQIPRLTNAQYDRTVRDLLGITALTASGNVAPSTLLATDQAGGLTDLGWSAYTSVAEMIAAQVMSDPALRSNFLKCTPTGDGAACLHDTVIEFGRRAFRRPLTDAEVARFDAIVAKGPEITASGAPEEVAEVLLYMFLISPSFIQRAEISETPDGAGRFALSNHEVASRLSYMLWGTIPDEALNQAADQGQLSTSEQIRAQARRMLQDPRARQMVAGFHRDYLELGANTRWDSAQRDTTLFPVFDRSLIPIMAEETERFFDHVVFTLGGTFQEFFLSPIAFVNAATAPLYGLDPARFGSELEEITLDASQRPGFLTRVGFLNAYSSYNRTSPILRGVFITKDVLGIDPGTPPPGALETPLPEGADLDTNRKRVDAQTAGAACAGCHHNYINPPGFVMEAYDAVGTWQTQEASTGAPINTVADVRIDGEPVRVTGPVDLMARLAASPNAQRQYAQKWVSYAYERDGHPLDSCTVDDLATKITAGGYTVLDLITDLTQSESFRIRAVALE
ncbi:hypothetical protein SOCEGT47_001160 [Sorangium cellulosum]|uniref:DUF1592 domain-containing protein n=2 Tax=Sorangium cellulosum TaxID=56 RepID=A0A4P2PSY1_SORCE|nr:hypothetical protein SOCEGT47_001160 [Sorangium cellulosum]